MQRIGPAKYHTPLMRQPTHKVYWRSPPSGPSRNGHACGPLRLVKFTPMFTLASNVISVRRVVIGHARTSGLALVMTAVEKSIASVDWVGCGAGGAIGWTEGTDVDAAFSTIVTGPMFTDCGDVDTPFFE